MIDSIGMQARRQHIPTGKEEALHGLIPSPFERNGAELPKRSNFTMCQPGHCKLLGPGF